MSLPPPTAEQIEQELAELERLEKVATPGPWAVAARNPATYYQKLHPRQMIGSEAALRSVIEWTPVDALRVADYALIAAARNALPRLLAYARLGAVAADRMSRALPDDDIEGFAVGACVVIADEARRLGLLAPAQEAERR